MFNLLHGDCIAAQKELTDPFDVIWLDPPYNTKNKKNKAATYDRNKDFQRKNWQSFYAEWDDITNYVEWCAQWLEQSKRLLTDTGTIFICGSFHNIPDVALALRAQGFYTIQWVQWCIPNAFPNLSMTKMVNANQTMIWARKGERHYYDKEAAKRYNDGKNLRDYWLLNNDTQAGKRWKHPSKKPVPLVYRALDIATNKNKPIRVLDYFGGSGTTAVAVYNIATHYQIPVECTLVDREWQYIEMQKERLYVECNRQESIISTVSSNL